MDAEKKFLVVENPQDEDLFVKTEPDFFEGEEEERWENLVGSARGHMGIPI